MRHLTTISALILGLILVAAPAHADTILDFTQSGNGDVRSAITGGSVTNALVTSDGKDWYQISNAADAGVTMTIDGVTVTGTGWNRALAYVDVNDTHVGDRTQIGLYGDTTGNNGGLGAVQSVNTSYSGQPQDNIWNYESVQLSFAGEVTLGAATFRNGSHGTSFDSNADIWIRVDNATAWTVFDVGSSGYSFNLNLTGTTFEFFNPNAGAANNDDERFYVSTIGVSPVPEPTSMALFALGAGGLAIVRRRRKQSAA